MNPKLLIGPLTNLQDARSSAAVGFDLIRFSLARGDERKLTASMIWGMVNWLSGPGIVLDLNQESINELAEIPNAFDWAYLNIPADEMNTSFWTYTNGLILHFLDKPEPSRIQELLTQYQTDGKDLKISIHLAHIEEWNAYESWADHLFVQMDRLEDLEDFLKKASVLPYGLSLGKEAEEAPQQLDYERIDRFLGVFHMRFPEETTS